MIGRAKLEALAAAARTTAPAGPPARPAGGSAGGGRAGASPLAAMVPRAPMCLSSAWMSSGMARVQARSVGAECVKGLQLPLGELHILMSWSWLWWQTSLWWSMWSWWW
jgi:hypothetical protein